MSSSVRSAAVVFVSFVACLLALSLPASATGCTATFTCSNACSILDFECSAPYCCTFSCSAPNQQVSCTGNTTCTVGTNSVTCDGVQHTCSAQQCFQSRSGISCGSTSKTCNSHCAC
jgi:hypothetical protein